jgi:hypothetical protein
MLTAAASVAIAVGCGLGGWGLHGGTSPSPVRGSTAQPALRTAALVTAGHQPVGRIFVYRGSPHWVYMTVDTGGGNGTVTCQLVSRDGQVITVGSFGLYGGYGYWGAPEPAQAAALTGARLTTSGGTVLATATFSAPR